MEYLKAHFRHKIYTFELYALNPHALTKDIYYPGHMLPHLRRHQHRLLLRLTLAQDRRSFNVIPLCLLTVITKNSQPTPRSICCIYITVVLCPAARTGPLSDVQRQFIDNVTIMPTSFRTRKPAVNFDKITTIPVGFIFELTNQFTPTCISGNRNPQRTGCNQSNRGDRSLKIRFRPS